MASAVASAVASNWMIGFLGSDPNSGHCLRARQQSSTDLGSDPNNPNPFSPHQSSAVASNWVVVVDALLSVFILAPLTPPALSRPAGRKRGPTAIFGRVSEVSQYTRHGALNHTNQIFPFSTCLSSGYFFALNTRPNEAPPFRPAGREGGGGDRVGPK